MLPQVGAIEWSLDARRWHPAERRGPLTPPSRTNRTRRVPHPVLIGHAASLTPY